ncbi:hypothetical protein VaNZ11_014782 [Volvox africanus]|uniref:Uncharacterized protein n=1 Tax=Volvox africanus TaxID=51714 RepID=A0ABQ5SKQ1_9CHLO|nr:hypothetical protein VaNZ11_014782 [Volvox africanus]
MGGPYADIEGKGNRSLRTSRASASAGIVIGPATLSGALCNGIWTVLRDNGAGQVVFKPVVEADAERSETATVGGSFLLVNVLGARNETAGELGACSRQYTRVLLSFAPAADLTLCTLFIADPEPLYINDPNDVNGKLPGMSTVGW